MLKLFISHGMGYKNSMLTLFISHGMGYSNLMGWGMLPCKIELEAIHIPWDGIFYVEAVYIPWDGILKFYVKLFISMGWDILTCDIYIPWNGIC